MDGDYGVEMWRNDHGSESLDENGKRRRDVIPEVEKKGRMIHEIEKE